MTIIACGRNEDKNSFDKKQFYDYIDREIQRVEEYDQEKERKIENLKNLLSKETTNEGRKKLTDELIGEYEAFISDSALFYVNKNLENPAVQENLRLTNELLIKKADIAAHAGLFGESAQILENIDKASLDSVLMENYYSAYCDLYQYQSEYATDSEYAREYQDLRKLYIDSVSAVTNQNSINYLVNHAAEEARRGNLNEAEKLLLKNINKYQIGNRNYSIISSILGNIYRDKGDEDNYRKYISLSVISDLRGAIKENMAMRALATECFNDGDVERADRYLRKSFSDANFYSARMRNAQSSQMLPVIGDAYNRHQKKMTHELRLLVIFMSILAFGFILTSIFAFIQVKKVRAINKKTKEMLDEVSALSDELSKVNQELIHTNNELQTSNKIRGEYGALFMEYSSLAISALQRYQQSLKVAVAQGNQIALLKKIDSVTIETKTLAEFYSKFDEAIRNIYPQFVERFNALLRPEEQINLKPEDGLNTELRVFALIKIGITDSEKIAKFLRCSITTVYTYRSKMKKKAIDPDTFEDSINNI